MGYFEHQGTVHKAVSVLKRRNGNHEHTIRELTMDSGGLHVGPVLQEFEGIATGNPRYIGSKTKDIKGQS
jgi:circadian clock protein KaiC